MVLASPTGPSLPVASVTRSIMAPAATPPRTIAQSEGAWLRALPAAPSGGRYIGAKLMGAGLVIGVDGDSNRLQMSRAMGADLTLDYREMDVVAEIRKLTGGGADVTIEALGTQETFENALRSLRPGGTLSSLGVYSGKLQIP